MPGPRLLPDEWLDRPPDLPAWVDRMLPDLDDEVGRNRYAWLVALVLIAGLTIFVARGANRPPDPMLDPTTAASAAFPGFDELAFRVRPSPADPRVAELATAVRCALVADTPEQHAQGLMGVTDLAGYDGMVFRFDADTDAAFHMRDTPLPLSIAFFDRDGKFVSATDMAPCIDGGDCPLHEAIGQYRYALEVAQGRLAELGIGPQSQLVLGGPCLR